MEIKLTLMEGTLFKKKNALLKETFFPFSKPTRILFPADIDIPFMLDGFIRKESYKKLKSVRFYLKPWWSLMAAPLFQAGTNLNRALCCS